MLKKICLGVLLATLLCLPFYSCSKKDNPINGQEQPVVSDLKMEIDVSTSREVELLIVATKGLEPNIYRDDKLISQGDYSSGAETIKSLKTTFSHRGQALVCALGFSKLISDDLSAPIEISIEVKLYRDNKLTQTYTRKHELSTTSINEQFSLYSRP